MVSLQLQVQNFDIYPKLYVDLFSVSINKKIITGHDNSTFLCIVKTVYKEQNVNILIRNFH